MGGGASAFEKQSQLAALLERVRMYTARMKVFFIVMGILFLLILGGPIISILAVSIREEFFPDSKD